MTDKLSISKAKQLIKEAEEAFHHEPCRTCEVYLGYVMQLRIDSDVEGRKYLKEYMPARDQIHSHLGCDPCPPGILYGNYLLKNTSRLE